MPGNPELESIKATKARGEAGVGEYSAHPKGGKNTGYLK
jgi:hypothetical protein